MLKCKLMNRLGVAIYTNGNFRPCYVYRYQWHSDEQSTHSYMHSSALFLTASQLQRDRSVGEGAVAPPLLKVGGLSPSSFSHLFVLWLLYDCMVTILQLSIAILQLLNFINFVINAHGSCNWVAKLPQLARSSPDPVAVEIRRYVSIFTDDY